VLAWKNLPPKLLLGAALADHLKAGDAHFTELFFSCRLLNLAPLSFLLPLASRVGEPVTVTWCPTAQHEVAGARHSERARFRIRDPPPLIH